MHLSLKVLVLALVAPWGCDSRVCEELNDWGFACDGCDKMVTCINTNGNWTAIPVGICNTTGGEYCNSNTKSCTKTDSFCRGSTPQAFTCTGEGIFPDPYDLKSYHVCFRSKSSSQNEIKFEDTKLTCPKNSAFSPSINDCVANLTYSGRQFNCSRIGSMARWPGSKRVFYVCADKEPETEQSAGPNKPNEPIKPEELNKPNVLDEESGEDKRSLPRAVYPILFRCSPDKVFSNESSRCELESGGSIDVPTTFANTVSNDCTYRVLKKHPSDCRSYIYCNRKQEQVTGMCQSGSHFNETTQSCALGSC